MVFTAIWLFFTINLAVDVYRTGVIRGSIKLGFVSGIKIFMMCFFTWPLFVLRLIWNAIFN